MSWVAHPEAQSSSRLFLEHRPQLHEIRHQPAQASVRRKRPSASGTVTPAPSREMPNFRRIAGVAAASMTWV